MLGDMNSRVGSVVSAASGDFGAALCRALILATISGIRYRLETCGTISSSSLNKEESSWLEKFYSAAHHSHLSGSFLPDFQG